MRTQPAPSINGRAPWDECTIAAGRAELLELLEAGATTVPDDLHTFLGTRDLEWADRTITRYKQEKAKPATDNGGMEKARPALGRTRAPDAEDGWERVTSKARTAEARASTETIDPSETLWDGPLPPDADARRAARQAKKLRRFLTAYKKPGRKPPRTEGVNSWAQPRWIVGTAVYARLGSAAKAVLPVYEHHASVKGVTRPGLNLVMDEGGVSLKTAREGKRELCDARIMTLIGYHNGHTAKYQLQAAPPAAKERGGRV